MATTLLSTRSLARIAPRHAQFPVLDFLAPRTITCRQTSHLHSSTVSSPSTTPSPAPSTANGTPPRRTLNQEQRDFLDSAIRVNQAGELAAVLIYNAQTPPLIRAHPHLRPLMKHMYDQEEGHFKYFNQLIAKHRIRPTAMYPVWHAAATVLGWGTAVMGREAAMACTEAVETEIGNHYNEQVRVLLDWADKLEKSGEGVSEEFGALLTELRRIRDEELEHLDHAVENDAKGARPYELLTNVIRGGCRTAIKITEKL
ncbi:catabolite repression protein CAT5 [Dendryphion nanum]|uniref:5-demethoxyubiquinone hydroxylase, mitochondrial n=1 Tax=Dendryphion nanum TaxID=256645 RepID=A0A9P9EA06_9PLEO|nr:catabolite repression protein CAT5 [Dendryphion nanum]